MAENTHYIGSSVRLLALLRDSLTDQIIRSGTLPDVRVRPPGGAWATVTGIAWILSTDPLGAVYSVTALFVPTIAGAHDWDISSGAPYTYRVPDSFIVLAQP